MKPLDAVTLRSVLGPLASDAAGLDSLELDQLAQAIAGHGRRCVRPRPGLRLNELPFDTDSVPWARIGRFLTDSQFRPGSMLHYVAGDYAIQDAASLLPITLMQLAPGQHVCDCCAAPGGKSAAVLEALGGDGLLISNEVIASRVDTLQLALARTGTTNYAITNQPVERLAEAAADSFDCVLVDAPCTGQSLVARGKQSLSAFSERQITHSAVRQQSILRSAIALVRPGGRLVYSTCTFAFDENEAIVAWLRVMLPEWQPVVLDELAQWQTPGFEGCYRLWPHRDHCAGGFAAALMRPAHASPILDSNTDPNALFATASPSSSPSRHTARTSARRTTQRFKDQPQRSLDASVFSQWGRLHHAEQLWERRNSIDWFDPQISPALRQLALAGIEVATAFGEHCQPAYPLATMGESSWFTPHYRIELSDSEAIAYMSGTALHRSSADKGGWAIAQWRARPLGWCKQVGSQLKNHLPKPLRHPNLKAP